jgi:hypothetical protein
MFRFTKSALIHAVKKVHLATWTGLTEDSINKHLKLIPATTMGHMNQKRQNIRSTKEKIHESDDEDITPQGSGGEKKYMRLPISILPIEIIEKYQLTRLVVDGWIYLEICKGMYGLKQAGILANKLLEKKMKPFGYHPARHRPMVSHYKTYGIKFDGRRFCSQIRDRR